MNKVNEARRQIELIVNPPTARLGEVYAGRVVNITKFGAFVNIMPGRDGLVHISKLGRGKRINRVEDVLDLGDELQVRVDDIDPQGKVSLTPVGPDGEPLAAEGGAAPERSSGSSNGSSAGSNTNADADADVVSFEAAFDAEARQTFGDLGPGGSAGGNDAGASRGGGDRDRGGDRGARGGGDRGRRRHR